MLEKTAALGHVESLQIPCPVHDTERGVSRIEKGMKPTGLFRRTMSIALIAVICWLALVAWLALNERRLLFFPERTLAAEPSDFGLRAEELAITTDDGVTLHGWWIAGSGERVLIWYHGNAGNIADRLPNARWFVEQLGVSVVLVDYRGYGRSAGTPDEAGVYRDGLAIFDAAVARGVAARDIVLFGRSLGGAVADRGSAAAPGRRARARGGVPLGAGDGARALLVRAEHARQNTAG